MRLLRRWLARWARLLHMGRRRRAGLQVGCHPGCLLAGSAPVFTHFDDMPVDRIAGTGTGWTSPRGA